MGIRALFGDRSNDLGNATFLLNGYMTAMTDYEEALYRIGQATWSLYRKNLVYDQSIADLCKLVDTDRDDAIQFRHSVEDFEALMAEDSAPQGTQKVTAHVKQGVNNFFVRRDLQHLQKRMREHYADVGLRVCAQQKNPTIEDARLQQMCADALKLKADADSKWQQVDALKQQARHGSAFVVLLTNFMLHGARYSGTAWFRACMARIGGRGERKVVSR